MKYEIEIDGQLRQLELTEEGQQIQAVIDGRAYQATVLMPEANVYMLLMGNKVYELSVEQTGSDMQIKWADQRFTAQLVDHRKGNHKKEAKLTGTQKITAPMPGRVVQLLKQVGDSVAAGEGVVVVEAMKMQNALSSPKAGIVAAIKVTEGQVVVAGAVLAIIE